MPRLPDATALGERRIVESGRPIPQWDESAGAKAIEGLGNSLSNAGARIGQIASQQDADNQRLATARADAEWLSKDSQIRNSFKDDDDEYQKWPDRYQKSADEARKQIAETLIPDRRTREMWLARRETDVVRGRLAVEGRAESRNIDYYRATGKQTLENLKITYADSGDDEEMRKRVIEAGSGVIEDMRRRGVISEDQAREARQQWVANVVEAKIDLMLPEQRIDALRGKVVDIDGVVDRIFGAESGGTRNPDTARNPNSSAVGAGQFIRGTWLGMMRRYRPELTEGKSEADILALRSDRGIMREMTKRYAEENAAYLSKRGLPASVGNIYLSHFLGPAGAVDVLKAGQGTAVDTILPRETIAANRSVLAGKTVEQVVAWAERKMGGKGSNADIATLLPTERRVAKLQQAEREYAGVVRQQDILAERERAAWVDQTQFAASKGLYSSSDADRDFQSGKFKSFEEYNSVKRLADGFKQETAALDSVVGLLRDGGVLNPRDPSHKKGLEALDAQTGLTDALAKGDGQASVQAAQMFGRTGMIPDRQKGLLEGSIRSGDARQLEYTMTTLDQMYRRNPEAFQHAFSKDTFSTLQMWQSRIDQRPEVFREELTRASDPANIKAIEAREKRGREIVAKMEDKEIIKVFDESYIPFDRPTAPIATRETGLDVLRNEYAELYSQGYARLGDETKAKEFADARIKMTWASSKAGGGRLMKYAPEALSDILPKFGGEARWMEDQARAYVSTLAKAAPDVGMRTGEVRHRNVDYALVALPDTKAEIDNLRAGAALPNGRKSPSWRVVYIDPGTAELKDGGMFSFDVEKAREEFQAKWRAARQSGQATEDAVRANAEALKQSSGALRRAFGGK
jgi:hypothetical protein